MKRTVILLVILALLVGGLAGCKKTAAPPEVGTRGTIERTGVIDVNGDGIVAWNGGTIATYSDAGDTLTWSITGSTGNLVAGDTIVFEGATADGYETTFVITDPTSSDKTITFPNATGTVALNPYGASIEFEGTTADDYETTLAVADTTLVDKTITLPDADGTVMLSTLATNGPQAANAVWGASNGLVFEGATGGADAFETVLTPTDPTADRTVTLQDASGTVALTSQAVDMTLTATTNGNNAAERNEFIGLPRIKYLGLATGVDGTDATKGTVNYLDSSPTGEWAEIDGGTNLAVTADTSIYKDVTNSLKIAFTDVVDNEGVDGTITEDDLSTNEYIGFWLYSSVATEATYFDLTLDDTDGTDQVYAVPAVAANTWTWIEIDISGCDANCNTTNGVQFLATAAGGTALTAANVYLDGMYKWDTDTEEAIALALQTDGVLGCVKLTDGTPLVEYTGFFVAYRTGVDALVYITNEATDVHACLFAY